VERAERVHLAVARAFAMLGEDAAARRSFADAFEVVESRLSQIRDAQFRERYIATPVVQAIRSPDA